MASLGRILVLAFVFLVLYVTLFEHRLIYYPDRELSGAPESDFEDVRFVAGDGTPLHGWFIPSGSDRVLIVSHGNAGNISHRGSMGDFLKEELDVNVFMYDYRGYGLSEGEPSEEGTYSDIRGAYAYTRSLGYAPSNIYLMGQSLGSAIAVNLAAEEPVGGVILEAPFTSVHAIVRKIFHVPLGWVIRTRYDSVSKMSRIRVPVAVIHADGDPVLPIELGRELFEATNQPKSFFEIDGEIHEGAIMALGLERLNELKKFLFGVH
jgi:fermentation-respiration switch protein FrsA (DUF1100 family)